MNREFVHEALAPMLAERQVHIVRAAEEASELVKECAKALRFGESNRFPVDGPTNAEKIVTEYKDIGHALIDAGLLAVRGEPSARFTDDDFNFLGALAADLLRRIWEHNPDLVLTAFTPFVMGETEHGELAVWLGQPGETTPALATFGAYEEGVEEAVVWIVRHRDDPRAALAIRRAPNDEVNNG